MNNAVGWSLILAGLVVALVAIPIWRDQHPRSGAATRRRGGTASLPIPDPPKRVHLRDESRHDEGAVADVRERMMRAAQASDSDAEVAVPAAKWWKCRG